jgi:hypothetical protein
MFKNIFMLNWTGHTNPKIEGFHLENNIAKFFYSGLEVFMTISYDNIAVAISNDDCTFTKTWKEKGITQEEIKLEIDNFLEESEKKLLN